MLLWFYILLHTRLQICISDMKGQSADVQQILNDHANSNTRNSTELQQGNTIMYVSKLITLLARVIILKWLFINHVSYCWIDCFD